jgi:hypothetical protein
MRFGILSRLALSQTPLWNDFNLAQRKPAPRELSKRLGIMFVDNLSAD